MPKDRLPDKQWDLLVTEVRGLHEEEPETLGGIDEMSLARYLAGDCDEQERKQVERARHLHLKCASVLILLGRPFTALCPQPLRRPALQGNRRNPRQSPDALPFAILSIGPPPRHYWCSLPAGHTSWCAWTLMQGWASFRRTRKGLLSKSGPKR